MTPARHVVAITDDTNDLLVAIRRHVNRMDTTRKVSRGEIVKRALKLLQERIGAKE
jgi:hypothetical protein